MRNGAFPVSQSAGLGMLGLKDFNSPKRASGFSYESEKLLIC